MTCCLSDIAVGGTSCERMLHQSHSGTSLNELFHQQSDRKIRYPQSAGADCRSIPAERSFEVTPPNPAGVIVIGKQNLRLFTFKIYHFVKCALLDTFGQ